VKLAYLKTQKARIAASLFSSSAGQVFPICLCESSKAQRWRISMTDGSPFVVADVTYASGMILAHFKNE
jgi:hypothetical protein